jgi:hypothetical protein
MGVPITDMQHMPESDFRWLVAYAQEHGTPWRRVESLLTRLCWLIGRQQPDLPNDPTAYALDATAPPPAAKPADPPIPADFSPVNLRKRQPLT